MKHFLSNRWAHFFFLFALLIVFVAVVKPEDDFRQRIRYAVFDSYQKLKPRQSHGDVVIIDYDDESLSIVGQWPWPRNITAKIVDNLTKLGARSIAFDGVLAEPDRNSPSLIFESLPEEIRAQIKTDASVPDYDAELGKAIRESGIFVSAFSHGFNKETPALKARILAKSDVQRHFLDSAQSLREGTAQFLPVLREGAAGNGSFIALADIDGLIRKTNMVFTDGKELFPSLGLETIRVAVGGDKSVYRLGLVPKKFTEISSEYRIALEEYSLPIGSGGEFWIYYKVHDKKDYLPAYKVLDENFFPEIAPLIKGKIALIGSSAEGLKDLRATPVNEFLPGVEIHANVIEQILRGDFLFQPHQSEILENNFIIVVGIVLIVLAPFVGAVWMATLCFIIISLAWISSWNAFVSYGALIDPLYSSVSVFVIFSLSTMLTYIRTDSERRQIRQAFGLYISPAFMDELTKNPEKLKLGGETRELSVMFTDIRNFTAISEGMKPEELIQTMNDFLTPMSDLVMRNRGTIDKYIGDAMMAFWNAPLGDPDHARNACRAALGMQAAVEPINDSLKAKGRSVLLKVGIGINTGPCAVGNMGSRQRFAYSSLGDAVNMASRLEGQTKTYGVSIIIGEATREKALEFAALELDMILVKGKTMPVRIFALLGDESVAESPAFKSLKAEHEEMMEAYRARDFVRALKAAEKCESIKSGQVDGLYAFYRERLEDLQANPPGEGWDGVYAAKTK